MFNEEASRDSLLLLLAHWGLETGWGNSMWCFNVGNVKAGASWRGDYCYFKCNEILSLAQARRMEAANPDTAKITTVRNDGKAIIWFYPKHPGCKFRAFSTLEEGVLEHMRLLKEHKNFSKAWGAVRAGDPELFCIKLQQAGYFTADLHKYKSAVVGCFNTAKKQLEDVEVPNLHEDAMDPSLLVTAETFPESRLEDPTETSPFYSPFSSEDDDQTKK